MKSFISTIIIFYSIVLLTSYSSAQMTWNQACSFANSNYLAIPHSASLNITGSFTIEMWINPESSASQTLLQKRSGSTGYTIYLSSGRLAVRTNSLTRLLSRNALPLNKWTHIAASYSSTPDIFYIFINGVLDTTSTIAASEPLTNTDSLTIGVGANGEFTGKLDEIRIWNYARTNEANIQPNMRVSLATNSGIYSGLVLSLTFQDSKPTGTLFSLNDWTSNDNDAFNRGTVSFDMSDVPSSTISLNECLVMYGTNDYLAAPDHLYLSPTTGVTVEAWIYPRSFGAGQSIIVHKGTASGSVTDYRMSIDANRFIFKVNGTDVYSVYYAETVFPLRKWSHVAFSYSGTSGFSQFILNGEIEYSDTDFVGNIQNNNDSLYIGGTPSLPNFDGYIDEVRITKAALTYGVIANRVFTSVNESNDESATNVVFNFDGSLASNTESGPELFFRGGGGFSNNAYMNNSPVSPLSHSSGMNFQKGFYTDNPDLRIPATGTDGFMISDTIDVPISEIISDVNVFTVLNHTNEIKLILSLISPGGTIISLYGANTLIGSSDNITTIFDDQADSSLVSNRYVMFTPVVKPSSNINASLTGTNTLGKWKLRIQDIATNDTGILIGWGIQFNNQVKKKNVLSLSAIVQGFYNPVTNLMKPDTMRAFIRGVYAPYIIYDSSKIIVSDSGKANFIFNNVPEGEPVFIQIKHRNSIETWSRYTGTFSTIENEEYFDPFTSYLKYDFTKFQSAFGDNQILVDSAPVKYAIYNGDSNQDGIVDATDLAMVGNDALNFVTGYVRTDNDGNNFIDASDAAIADNNAANFVSKITP